ncbi:MAG: LysE family transporter [Aureispira sp.]|nr:LysE family transporter [Aureispira sp.]
MLIYLLLGCLVSFLGSLPVGMISLLVVETTINKNAHEGMQVALGASIIEVIQAFIAINFIALFIEYPSLETAISILSIPIFLLLGWQHIRSDGQMKRKTTRRYTSSFWKGLVVSSLNMLAIPFWILWGGVFMKQGWLIEDTFYLILFSVGVGIGSFLAMLVYILLGVFLSERLQQYNKWVNRFIGVLFLGLATIQIYFILTAQ